MSVIIDRKLLFYALMIVALVISSCSSTAEPELSLADIEPTASPTRTLAPAPVITPTGQVIVATETAVLTVTNTPIQTPSSRPAITKTATLTPTYAILRGEVLERANCRYGPGWPHLYKYGLPAGSNLEVIGRIPDGSWILVQAIGGSNPCWLKATLMDVDGDVMSVEPTLLALPPSPYYGALVGVSAARDGDQVTITWRDRQLRAGDETASPQYLVEAWVCAGGLLKYVVTGTDWNQVVFRDEQGCAEASYGQVYLVEKHGYSRPAEIPWPVWDLTIEN